MCIRDRLHGEEQFVSADAGYQGAPQREELAEVDVDWLIAERPGKVKTLKQHPRKNKTAINIEYMKASIHARVCLLYTSLTEVEGNGQLTKTGKGSLTLTLDNTYTGTTDVNEGVLLVNGNQSAATGQVTVKSGATLGGNGIIGGAVEDVYKRQPLSSAMVTQ